MVLGGARRGVDGREREAQREGVGRRTVDATEKGKHFREQHDDQYIETKTITTTEQSEQVRARATCMVRLTDWPSQ